MKIKQGASIQGLDIRMRPVLIAADQIWRELGQELVVTSGLDGTHSAGSLHYYGLALGFRTFYFTNEEKRTAVFKLKEWFNECSDDFDVILEKTHIHVECDVLRVSRVSPNV